MIVRFSAGTLTLKILTLSFDITILRYIVFQEMSKKVVRLILDFFLKNLHTFKNPLLDFFRLQQRFDWKWFL